MLPRLWKGVLVLLATFVLSAHCGSAQLLFDPASYLVPSRGALSHTLQSVPRLPRFLVATAPPPPPPAVPPPPPPPSDSAASPADSSLGALTPDELLDPSFLIDPGTQVPNISRHRRHGSTAGSLPPPADLQAAPTPAPEPSAAPALALGANSSANGTSSPHLTQIKDLLTPAPPAPPNAAPALAPEQALPPKAGSRQPESGRNDSNGTSCEGQGMQGRCNGCICCCAPKGSGGFVTHSPEGCECKREIRTSDIWLTLAMSALLIVPAAGVGAWFGGLFPVSPHRNS